MQIATSPTLGAFLRKERRDRGWSLDKFAAKVGVNKSTLSRWETGKTVPRTHELTAAFAALNLPSSALDSFQESLGRAPLAGDLDDTRPPVSGDLLRALRLRREWTQAEAARAVNISQSVLTKWETGDSWPAADRLHTLCFALGATPDETAILTKGRFLPSLLPAARSDADAIDLLQLRHDELGEQMERGNYDYAEFGLFQLEADAWRLARKNDAASDLIMDTVNLHVLFTGSRPNTRSRVRQVLRRGAGYVAALGKPNHPLALTQQIIGLQVLRQTIALRQAMPDYNALAGSLLCLIPRTGGASGADYRSWIYMEAATCFSSVVAPDVLTVKRLIAASFAEPHSSGSPRRDDPIAARYEARILAGMGQTVEAIAALERVMIGGIHTFRGLLLLARIAWANGEPDAALGYLRDATLLAKQTPGHAHLQWETESLRAKLVEDCAEVPMLAVK